MYLFFRFKICVRTDVNDVQMLGADSLQWGATLAADFFCKNEGQRDKPIYMFICPILTPTDDDRVFNVEKKPLESV